MIQPTEADGNKPYRFLPGAKFSEPLYPALTSIRYLDLYP